MKLGKYFSYYQKRSKKYVQIDRVHLESGMLCLMTYRSKDKKTKRLLPAQQYYVLILHPSFGFKSRK